MQTYHLLVQALEILFRTEASSLIQAALLRLYKDLRSELKHSPIVALIFLEVK
jgi:hypothetical protein